MNRAFAVRRSWFVLAAGHDGRGLAVGMTAYGDHVALDPSLGHD